MIGGFPNDGNEDWVASTLRKEHRFVNKLHTLEPQNETGEGVGPLRNKSPPFQKKPTWPWLKTRCERLYWREAVKKEGRWGVERGKGLWLKIWGAKERREGQLHNFCLFSCSTVKEKWWWLRSEHSLHLWFIMPQLSVQVGVIMVLGFNRAEWPQLVLRSNIKINNDVYTAAF